MPYSFPASDVATWTPENVIALLCQPGYMSPDDWRPITGAAVVFAESGAKPRRCSDANWNPANQSYHLTIDLGMFQLNEYANVDNEPYPGIGTISRKDCFDPFEAWEHVWKIINRVDIGWQYNWELWTGYTSGAYDKFIKTCFDGMRSYRSVMGLPPGVFG